MSSLSRSMRVCATAIVLALSVLIAPIAPGAGFDLAGNTAYAANGDDWNYYGGRQDDCKEPSDSDKSESTDSSSDDTPPDTGGDWLTKGSDANKVAQELYDVWTKEYGTSGAFAVGVLANVNHESAGFQIDIVEGGAHAGNDKKSGSSAGGGLYQFTPATKYENSDSWHALDKSNGWAPKNQTHYVWETEIGNSAILPYLKADAYGRGGLPSDMKSLLTTDDPRMAARAFQTGYERPAVYHPEREDSAAAAAKVFDADKKADESKLKIGGSDSSGGDSVDLDSDAVDKAVDSGDKDAENCTPNDGKDHDGGGGSLGKDASGEHGLNLSGTYGQSFKRDKVPDNLKKYALDPTSVGLKNQDCGEWTKFTNTSEPMLNGQCVALSKSAFGKFWTKGGDPKGESPASFNCNGDQCADSAASAIGGKWSKTPKRGAVVSVDTGQSYGHTYVVSHVFANGDIMIIEQNTPDSGWALGKQCDWNYRVVPKNGYQSENARFYTPPDDKGYKPNTAFKTQ